MELEDELSRMGSIDLVIAGASAYVGYSVANGSLDDIMLVGIGGAIAFRTALNAAKGAIRSYQNGVPIAQHAVYGARQAATHASIYAGTGLVGGIAAQLLTRAL